MVTSGYNDPVGMVIDTSDRYGAEISKAVMKTNGIDYHLHLDTCIAEKIIPTMLIVLPLEVAKKLLQYTADSAAKNLSTPLPPNTYWFVCMARGGNTYAGMNLPSDRPRGIKPGHHRM
jgi:hypothetical protein